MSVESLTQNLVIILNEGRNQDDLLPFLGKSLSAIIQDSPSSNFRNVLLSSCILSPVASNMAIDFLSNSSDNTICSKYRRISKSRLQSICTFRHLDFIWESNSISDIPDWKLHRICLEDPDNEELYWKPWFDSVNEAETEHEDTDNDDNSSSPSHIFSNASIGSSILEEDEDEEDEHINNLRKLKELTMKLGELGSNPYEPREKKASSFQRELLFENYQIRPSLYDIKDTNDEEDDYWNRYDDEYQISRNYINEVESCIY